ncbi:MAG: hypothetical protein ABIQ40_18875 [Bacteroidia bacterium]
MKSILKKILLGITHPQEYICAAAGTISGGLDCYALVKNERINVTDTLLFLGYRPLVMGWITKNFEGKELELQFVRKDNQALVATLKLKTEKKIPLEEKTIYLFKGIASLQKFESRFHQFMFRLYERLRPKQNGNIDLDPELYNQVKIAYSIPREIKVVTLGKENKWNVFPTDLHGKAGASSYIISLRHDKQPCRQLIETGKLALWSVNADHAQGVYAMGKNHSRDFSSAENFSFTDSESPQFHFPEPAGAIGCEELELQSTIADVGIHRIFLLKPIHANSENDTSRLVHLHRSYLQWHIKNGFPFTEAKR